MSELRLADLAHPTWVLGRLVHDHPDLEHASVHVGQGVVDDDVSISVRVPEVGDVSAWAEALGGVVRMDRNDGGVWTQGTRQGVVVRAHWHPDLSGYRARVRELRAERAQLRGGAA